MQTFQTLFLGNSEKCALLNEGYSGFFFFFICYKNEHKSYKTLYSLFCIGSRRVALYEEMPW